MMISFIGFIILPITAMVLFAYIFQGNVMAQGYSWLFFLQVFLLFGLIYGITRERKKIFADSQKGLSFGAGDLYNLISVLIGAYITFVFNNNLEMGAVVASGLVGTIAAIMIPKYAVPLYCGSFVGMASCSLFTSYGHLTAAGLIAGMVFVLAKDSFNGFGGKLGTTALTGCILASVFAGKEFLGSGPIPGWETGKYYLFYSVVAAIAAYAISIRLKHGAVFGSGIVGLLAGLVMPAVYPTIGGSLAVMMICASFAGMSTQVRMPNEIYIGLAGVLSAFLFIYSMPYFGGTGGKLGTVAFISCIVIRGFLDLYDGLKSKRS